MEFLLRLIRGVVKDPFHFLISPILMGVVVFLLFLLVFWVDSIGVTVNSVLSFGVGGECKFEKLMLHENDNLKIELFDPTPYTVKHIESIMHRSGRKLINDVNRNRNLTRQLAKVILFYQL